MNCQEFYELHMNKKLENIKFVAKMQSNCKYNLWKEKHKKF